MAKLIIVANWKNHPNSIQEAQALLKNLSKKRLLYKKASLFIAPPTAYLGAVAEKAKSFSQLASQDISNLPKGTYTGETSPEMLKSFGVRMSIVGHSERRALGETTANVAAKIKAALGAGISALVCFGEKEKDAEGEHFEFLRQELKSLLGTLPKKDISKIALAYEPVWAIGRSSDEAIGHDELKQTVIFIKKVLTDMFGRDVADKVPVLYGGSVEPSNAKELLNATGVRGFLVGHASLKAKDLEIIVRAVTEK